MPKKEQENSIVVLKNNYRSSQEILDIAAESIEHNKERLVNQIKAIQLDKNLIASGAVAKGGTIRPLIVEYPSPSHEVADIANQIEALER